jgi:ankyrin repeat protein
LLSYAILGWKHLGHVSDEDSYVMAALSRLNSEFRRNSKKHRVLATQNLLAKRPDFKFQPATDRWLSAAVALPSLLFIPLEHGKPWMVEFVVKQHLCLLDMDIAPGWGSPLIFAIAKNPDCLSVLLKLGVNLNKLSSFKPHLYSQYIGGSPYAPISWAAATGNKVAVDFLLSQTEVNVPDDILHVVVRASKPSHELIRKFCQRGADVNFAADNATPLHYFLSFHPDRLSHQLLPVVKALVEPSCNLFLQDRTARTVLHIALDHRLEDIVTYLLERNAGLSATAALLPDKWSWATNKTWFPKVEAAAQVAAVEPYTRIKGMVFDAPVTWESKIVEFSVAVTADHNNPNPICAIVVSAILDSELSSEWPLSPRQIIYRLAKTSAVGSTSSLVPTFHIVIGRVKRRSRTP